MTKFLVIKGDWDEFETMFNEQFRIYADVLPFSTLYDYHSKTIKDRCKQIRKTISDLNNIGYFNNYDYIIVFDNIDIAYSLFLTIKDKKRIILWLWNKLLINRKYITKFYTVKHFCSVWTFDRYDAKKYGLNFNTQFYINIDEFKSKEHTTDVFFIGLDKGRKSILHRIEEECKKYNIESLIIIVGDNDGTGRIQGPIMYSEVLKFVSTTNAVLEICQDQQMGLTSRALEAVFFERKLITNNKSIYAEKYFNESNTLVIDSDNLDSIANFVSSPNKGFCQEASSYYSIESWLYRFVK